MLELELEHGGAGERSGACSIGGNGVKSLWCIGHGALPNKIIDLENLKPIQRRLLDKIGDNHGMSNTVSFIHLDPTITP